MKRSIVPREQTSLKMSITIFAAPLGPSLPSDVAEKTINNEMVTIKAMVRQTMYFPSKEKLVFIICLSNKFTLPNRFAIYFCIPHNYILKRVKKQAPIDRLPKVLQFV